MNVIKQDFHGPARWFSGQKGASCHALPPEFCPQDLHDGMREFNPTVILWPSYTVWHIVPSLLHTHTCLPGMHGALGSIPSNWEKRWGGSGRRKEWRRNIYERNLELCEWPSYICTLPHAPGHTLNAAPCTCRLLPCPPACLPVRSIFLLTRMTPPPPATAATAFNSRQALRSENAWSRGNSVLNFGKTPRVYYRSQDQITCPEDCPGRCDFLGFVPPPRPRWPV